MYTHIHTQHVNTHTYMHIQILIYTSTQTCADTYTHSDTHTLDFFITYSIYSLLTKKNFF